MKTHSSLKWQILKKVIIVHGIIAIFLTLLQLKLNYDTTLNLIKKNLTSSYDMFGPPLSQAFYHANLPMLEEIFQGILSQEDFLGVAIYDSLSNEFISRGKTQIDSNILLKYISTEPLFFELNDKSNTIGYQSPIKILIEKDKKKYFGNLIVFSSKDIAFKRNLSTVYIVFFNSIIKAIVLLVLFILLFNRLLINPLTQINDVVSNLSSNNIKSLRLNLQTPKSHELYTFQIQFNKLLDDLNYAQEQERLLQHKSKCIAIGDMIGNIAHQWRQPIATVNMIIIVLLEKQELKTLEEKELTEKLLEIENQNKYMSETIENFLDLFKQNKKTETFSLYQLINSTKNILKTKLENNNIQLKLDIPENITMKCDAQNLTQLLIIIFSNAIDSIINKGDEYNKNIEVSVQKNEKTTIVIKDYGTGIDKENMFRIFEPYFSTKHESQGVGLGLYIAKKLIEKSLHGHIDVENHPNGAIFKITI